MASVCVCLLFFPTLWWKQQNWYIMVYQETATYWVKWSLLIIATQTYQYAKVGRCHEVPRHFPIATPRVLSCVGQLNLCPAHQESKAERLALLIWRLASSNFRSPEFLLANFREMSMWHLKNFTFLGKLGEVGCSAQRSCKLTPQPGDLRGPSPQNCTFQTGSISRFSWSCGSCDWRSWTTRPPVKPLPIFPLAALKELFNQVTWQQGSLACITLCHG